MEFSRREFVRTAAVAGAVAGAGLATTPIWADDEPAMKEPPKTPLNVAIIGAGSQGRNLVMNAIKIPGVRFKAICDIWQYSQKYTHNILKKYDMETTVYEDYHEMLDKEKDLDAVIVATPDWMHAEHTIACLKAGKAVYCEKEMANNLDNAMSMVKAQRETGKLLQIGHQRRSNPRYHHALKLIEKDKVLGQITGVYGQWNRAQMLELGWPKGQELSDETLKKYGYDDMDQYRNWRWYKKYSGGPMADLGSHQVDVFSWFLRRNPASVMASGSLDYYTEKRTGKKRDWYDNVVSVYTWDADPKVENSGAVRGVYCLSNTSSNGGFYETFMGDQGTMVISEDTSKGFVFREDNAKRREWEDQSEKVEAMDRKAIEMKIGETLTADGKKDPKGQALLEESKKPPHQLHLENFFNTLRDPKNFQLTCPPEVAYETAVMVLTANTSIAERKTVDFKPEQFKA